MTDTDYRGNEWENRKLEKYSVTEFKRLKGRNHIGNYI